MDMQKYGPWAVVAGASAGLGAAFAEEVARRGVNVVTIARREALLEAEAERLRSTHGIEVRPVVADLGAAELADLVRPAVADIDVGLLIYNATIAPTGRFLDVPLEEHLLSIRVNCNGPTVLAHLLAPPMVARGAGGLVFVGSTGALQGGAIFASYFAAKAYDWILGEGLWAELEGTGVDVISYMVGATAGDNFEIKEHEVDLTLGDGEVDEDLQRALDHVRNPATPAAVAARMFETLGHGPTTYSVEDGEQAASRTLAMPRRTAVENMSRLTTSNWG